MTLSYLRPDPAVLGEEWDQIVEAEYEQVERLREWRNNDFYQPIARQFTDDPWRNGDEILDALRAFGRPDATWLDIGAGGGRYALPLSLTSRRVIAVDPSSGMRDALREEIERHGFQNIEQLDMRWPEGADGVEADFSLAAHVSYDIRDINAFIDGMERATGERCIALMMDRAPSGGFERLWEAVHGEPRLRLPAMRDFVHILLARGATPEIRNFQRDHGPNSAEELLNSARRRLWLAEGSEKDQHLQQILASDEIQHDDFQMPALIAMISWRP
jgi:ubiquinone/menaquinone biosynthesis C-methylase UbiE